MPPLEMLGKYEIIEELGRGGFATVYKARDPGLNRSVALKVLHPYWSNDPGLAARFRREAQAAAGLRHPNIVSVHEAGEVEGQLYIAMAYLPGQTLREVLAAEGALPLERALPILTQIADALDYAHEQGAVHRDVKPANIMVEERGQKVQATLLDFGLVKAIEGSVALTSQGTLLGSPEYMAPEQADPEHAAEVGPAAGRYALGIVAYHMLTGRVPFPGNTPSTLNAHEHKPVPPPRSFQPELSETVAAVLLKMLAKAPGDRYPSACAFVEELERAQRQSQRSRRLSVDAGTLHQTPRWVRGVAVVLLILVCLGLGSLGAGLFGSVLIPTKAAELPTYTPVLKPTATPAPPASTPTPPPPTPTPPLDPGAIKTRPADGMVMLYVPAGTFPMGSAADVPDAEENEKPRHEVTLDAFWIDRTEVTNAQYTRCVETGVCQQSSYADDLTFNGTAHPVVGVSWQDAADYCRWAGGRLPSEAEWEYAARGPDGRIYPWGDTFECNRVNADDETSIDDYVVPGGAGCDGYSRTAPVGSFPSGVSWVGALDMAGNVLEWVNDWYSSDYYLSSPSQNPTGPIRAVTKYYAEVVGPTTKRIFAPRTVGVPRQTAASPALAFGVRSR